VKEVIYAIGNLAFAILIIQAAIVDRHRFEGESCNRHQRHSESAPQIACRGSPGILFADHQGAADHAAILFSSAA
jgi:hypothetical protein